MAALYHVFVYWSDYYGTELPEIISGYRTPGVQANLRRKWDLGNRTGIKVRPALGGRHPKRQAFDLEDNGYLPWLGSIARYYGYRWGGDFVNVPDPNHFFIT